MTDIRERLSETIRKALFGDGTVDYCLAPSLCESGPCPCCMNAVHDVLAQIPLTQAQLDGLASGDMVVVPRKLTEAMTNDAAQACLNTGLGDFLDGSGCNTVSAKLSDKEIASVWQAMISAAQEKQP